MSGQERPSTRSGTAGGRLKSARPGTSASRPMTAAGGRAASRSGTADSSRPPTANPAAQQYRQDQYGSREYIEEEEEEYDEDDYETEDDGDVFAFVPPDLGPSADVVQLEGPNVTVADPTSNPGQSTTGTGMLGEEETFYYDEATGAVYDAQGRLVDMPADFDPNLIGQQQPDTQTGRRPFSSGSLRRPLSGATALDDVAGPKRSITNPLSPVGDVSITVPAAVANPSPGHSLDLGQGMSSRLGGGPSMPSLTRQDSNASSLHRDMNTPILNHARAISGFPVSMEALMEIPHSREGAPSQVTSDRDVGMTALGGQQLDEMGRDVSGQLRKRTNRLSQAADAGMSPMHDLPFNLTTIERRSPYDEVDDKLAGEYMDNGLVRDVGLDDGMKHSPSGLSQYEMGNKRLRMVELELETEEDSPYPEVRASVSNIDDPDMPCGTLRAWFLCFILSTFASAVNTVLSLRYPAPTLMPIVMQLIAYPCGKLLAATMPIRTFYLPSWLGGGKFSLNPGLFNIKEHTLITIVMNLCTTQAYSLYTVLTVESTFFYGISRPILFTILYTISTSMIGMSLAGMSRRFLVWPASMVWPQNLVITTILNTLHAEDDAYDSSMSRFRFFSFVMGGAFLWNFVPSYLFNALSTFGWLCWIWPNNFIINTLFGTQTGLGLSVLTFDWNQINYIGSPLIFPWWAECNTFAGFVLWLIVCTLSLYFTNTLYTSYMPFNTTQAFDNHGQPYDIFRVIKDLKSFDVESYESYSPLFLSATYTMLYTTGFAAATALLSHTVLYHGKALWRGVRRVRTEEDDIHAKFMRRYPEVPSWWYFVLGVLMFILGIICIEVYDTDMPVWALVVAVAIPIVYFLPSGFIYAMTGTTIGTNLIGEVVAGYSLPGLPLANMIFKTYAFNTLSNGLTFVQDLKLGHYMKVPPRQSFAAQTIFTIWNSFVQIGVLRFMISRVADLCAQDQEHRFSCPHARVFFTSSIVWGIIGPQRLFGNGGLYKPLYWAMLAGLVLPVPFWFLARKYPKSWLKFVSVPIVLSGATFSPPASGIVYTAWFTVAFIFQYLIRKYNFRWWSKYNFVTSAALDAGTIISTLVIFLVLQLPKDGTISIEWWGNTVSQNTLDANPTPWKMPPANGFGPPPKA